MGHLWRAVHRGLDREVALKLVDMRQPGVDERVARILCEAEICAAVRHRNVVEIYDADTTLEGQPYIVMELLVGETLAQRMARPPSMRLDELVRLLAQCLSGLEAVHEAGVIHRDLKPENIVLATDRGRGIVPKIVDFGISCRGLQMNRKERLTIEGTLLGTPWYMPPEQASGRDVGPEADVYAMGVIAYEALTGRLPFDSDSLFALLLKITSEEAPPLSYYRPDLPVALSEVVAKAMARAPERRFGTAAELRDALLRAIDGADLAYAALVPSESVMVLPDDPEAGARGSSPDASPAESRAAERALESAFEARPGDAGPSIGAELAREPGATAGSFGRRAVATSVSLAFVAAASVFLAGGKDPIEPPAEATRPQATASEVAVVDVAAPAAPRAEPISVGEVVAHPEAADRAEPEEGSRRPKPRARRGRAAPAAFRRLDF